MAVLVIAEHDDKTIKPSTLNTVTAAAKLGGDITVMVIGNDCPEAAQAAANVSSQNSEIIRAIRERMERTETQST